MYILSRVRSKIRVDFGITFFSGKQGGSNSRNNFHCGFHQRDKKKIPFKFANIVIRFRRYLQICMYCTYVCTYNQKRNNITIAGFLWFDSKK